MRSQYTSITLTIILIYTVTARVTVFSIYNEAKTCESIFLGIYSTIDAYKTLILQDVYGLYVLILFDMQCVLHLTPIFVPYDYLSQSCGLVVDALRVHQNFLDFLLRVK